MSVNYSRGHCKKRGTITRLVFQGRAQDFAAEKPHLFKAALEALGVPICVSPEHPPEVISENYLGYSQRTAYQVNVAGVIFEFEISDKVRSFTKGKAVYNVMEEIANGAYWEDPIEERAGGEDSGRDNQVSSDA